MRRFRLAAAFVLPTMAAISTAGQAVAVGAPRLRPNVVLVGGVGLAVTPSTLNLTLVRGGVSAAQPVTITTTVAGLGLADTLVLTAYFASTNALTTGSGDSIASSSVLGSCSTCLPTGFTPIAQSSAFAAASSLVLINQTSLLTVLGGSRTDTLNLKIDLSSSPQTPAGSYTGTLVLAAQIF